MLIQQSTAKAALQARIKNCTSPLEAHTKRELSNDKYDSRINIRGNIVFTLFTDLAQAQKIQDFPASTRYTI